MLRLLSRQARKKAIGKQPARLCGLFVLFRESMKTTPIAYLNGLRLSHACLLLESTRLSITQIAENCGIRDGFYFSKMFQSKYGVSPLQYRKRYCLKNGEAEKL